MRRIAWALLAIAGGHLLSPRLQAGDPGVRAWFIGGTVAELSPKTEGRIDLTDGDSFLIRGKAVSLTVPYRNINVLEYGQHVSRRYAEAILISPVLLLAKSRKHFITLGFTDAGGKQQAVVLRVNKNDIRSVLAALEARTGRRVEYQDDEARKSGKG